MYILISLGCILYIVMMTYGCGGQWMAGHLYRLVYEEPINSCNNSAMNNNENFSHIREDTQFLILQSNQLDDEDLGVFLTNLEVQTLMGLDLGNNQITVLPDLTIWKNTLRFLSLSNNKIEIIDFNYFVQFISLLTLELRNNPFKSTSTPGPLNDTLHLKYLYFDYNNQLGEINFNDFVQINGLKELFVGGESVKEIIFPVNHNLSVETLAITGVSANFNTSFNNILNLKNLRIRHCIFLSGWLDLNVFKNLKHLTTLAFRQTHIERIIPLEPENKLENILNLILYNSKISGCFNLSHIPVKQMPKLHVLELSGIINQEIITFCPSNETEHNLIITTLNRMQSGQSGCIDFDTILLHLPNIKILKFSKNKFDCFIGHSSNLERLELRNNQFTELNLEKLSDAAPHLNELDMKNNLLIKITGRYTNHLQILKLQNNPLVAFGAFCEPYFNQLSEGLQLYIGDTRLQCNRCLAWLKTCPYSITLVDQQPICNGPGIYTGQYIGNISGLEMADMSCSLGENAKWFIKDNSQSPLLSSLMISVSTNSGEQDCARRTEALNGASFSYNETSNVCDIYADMSGIYDTK